MFKRNITWKRLAEYRKSFTVRVAIFTNTLLGILLLTPEVVATPLKTIFEAGMVDAKLALATAWLPLLNLLGVIKGRVDSDHKVDVSLRDEY